MRSTYSNSLKLNNCVPQILLMVAAVVSLSLGLFQDFGTPRPDGEPPVDWVEGVTILVAIVIVVLVGSLNDWQKEKQFKVLNEKREECVIKVIRDGEEQMTDIHGVVLLGSPSLHTSSLQPPPPPTLSAHSTRSIRFATSKVLRNNNPEEHDGMSSLKLLAPPPPHHRRKGCVATVSSVGSSWSERRYEDNQGFRPSPMRSAHSDAPRTLPSPTHTHVDIVSDAPSRPSSPASSLRKTFHRVRESSPSPSGETDTGSDTARNDGQRKGNSNIKRKGPELARPALSGLKQEADIDVHPFAFKPLRLASLVDTKSLETESMGGVYAILRGLGTQPTYGLRNKLGPPPSHAGSRCPTFQDFRQFMRLAPKDKVLVRRMCSTYSNV